MLGLPRVVCALCLTAVTVTFVSLSPSSTSGGRRLLMDDRARAARLRLAAQMGMSTPAPTQPSVRQPNSLNSSQDASDDVRDEKAAEQDPTAAQSPQYEDDAVAWEGNEDGWGDDDDTAGGWGEDGDDEWSDGAQAQSPRAHCFEQATPEEKDYELLSQEMLNAQIHADAEKLAETLGLSPSAAEHLLRLHKWNSSAAMEAYFADSEAAMKKAGILNLAQMPDPVELDEGEAEGTFECPICYDDFPPEEFDAAECGHQVCPVCWKDTLKGYRKESCVDLRCPQFGCGVKTSPEMIQKYLSPELLKQYERFRFNDYVGNNRCLKWCPTRNCTVACKIEPGMITEVHCSGVDGACEKYFCTKCNEEGHQPAPCATAHKWRGMSGNEALNRNYIYANTKECPRCKKRIEKNQGCMHMTCSHKFGGCGHQFCWLCKGDWRTHGENTGGYFSCNIHERNQAAGVEMTLEERIAERAKELAERFENYADRYNSHMHSLGKAEETKQAMQERIVEMTASYCEVGVDPSKLEAYLMPALDTVIECHRLLAWTHPIGFYMSDDFPKKHLFMQYQAELQKHMEALNKEVEEKDAAILLSPEKRTEIIHKTRVVQDFRDNLVTGVQEIIQEGDAGTESLYTTQQDEYDAMMQDNPEDPEE